MNNIKYDSTRKFRAARDDSRAGFFQQDDLIWQAQYYDENSQNSDKWERLSYYPTPEAAIEGAKVGKRNNNLFNGLFGG